MGTVGAVASGQFDADALEGEFFEVDDDLVPIQINVTTIGGASLSARAADVEGGHVGAGACRSRTDVAQGVALSQNPVVSDFLFDGDDEFRVVGIVMLTVLLRG